MSNEDSLATILLVGHLGVDDVTPLKAAEFWDLCRRVESPAALLGTSRADLASLMDGDPDRADDVAALLARGTRVAFELERLGSSGIAVLTPFDDSYPRRLGDRLGPAAPPVLYVAGALAVPGGPTIGIVGDGGGDVTAGAARALTEGAVAAGRRVVVAEGTTVGRIVAEAAVAVEGTVVGVVAGPLGPTLRHPEIRRSIIAGHAALCTPYGPGVRPGPATTRGRSRLVHALGDTTVVLDTGPEGAETWTGAVDALGWGAKVAVWHGDGDGSDHTDLEERGATPVSTVAEALALGGSDAPAPSPDESGSLSTAPPPVDPVPDPTPTGVAEPGPTVPADPELGPSPSQGSLFDGPGS